MDAVIANASLERLGVVGLCVYAVLAFMRGWIVPGSRVREVRAHYEIELTRMTSSHEAIVGIQAALLATEREHGGRTEKLNLRLMGYVEAAMTVPSREEA